jgi:hypothetical protein
MMSSPVKLYLGRRSVRNSPDASDIRPAINFSSPIRRTKELPQGRLKFVKKRASRGDGHLNH